MQATGGGVVIVGEFGDRRAPYAPISALEQFLERIRDRSVPEVIDHRFLKKLNVASNNEYALLSALKFLGIIDPRGRPTTSYRSLQSEAEFRESLRRLVEQAYEPAFSSGAVDMANEDLVEYFKRESSPSQGRNAARFFKAVCGLSGIGVARSNAGSFNKPRSRASAEVKKPVSGESVEKWRVRQDLLLETKSRLLEKLPAPLSGWSAADYQAICDRFVAMLESLDRSL